MSNHTYTSIDRIFSKLIRDFTGDFSETDVVEWCGEALEFIGAVRQYEETVAFVEVKNHQCQLPKYLHSVIQVARYNGWLGSSSSELCPSSIIASLPVRNDFVQDSEECCGIDLTKKALPDYIVLDCNGQPINDYEVAYYRPFFDVKSPFPTWSDSSFYRSKYSPVRLSSNTFFNNLVCTETDRDKIYQSCKDEYTIIQGKTLRFSFKEGSVAIAYNKQLLDAETGYPLIPDDISYTTAIVKYITMKMMEKEFYAGREGAKMKMEKAESDWQWYCGQASCKDKMPQGVDEYQNLLNQRMYLLPRENSYYSFFGNLNNPENRRVA